jgi:type VI secretion system protein VasG
MVDAILTNTVLPAISQEVLNRMLADQPIARVHVGVEEGNLTYAFE